jgi:ABC-type multidrug transport system ATPase subunit
MASQKSNSPSSLEIHVNRLGKRFNREWIFRNLDYTFKPAHVYAVTGPNGSGKSTFLQVLWGQLPQSTGELKYQHTTGEVPVDEIYKYLTVATPYLDLIEEFTLIEHLRFHFSLKSSRSGMTVSTILEKMKLTHAQHKHIANFSSGMKQRVKLGLAFFTQANLIFLDEPTTNLDSEASAWYHEQLKSVSADSTVIIASNDSSEYPVDAQIVNVMDFK